MKRTTLGLEFLVTNIPWRLPKKHHRDADSQQRLEGRGGAGGGGEKRKKKAQTEATDREGGGRGIQDGEHMYTHGWFMSMYGKNHCNIVK